MKNIIVYFTWSGNSKKIAEKIGKNKKVDFFEIQTIKKYPTTYLACVAEAGVEKVKKERPKLQNYLDTIEEYEKIILVFPNWWSSLPNAVLHFLENYDFSGKTILPICTHGGGGVKKIRQHIIKVCPNSTILETIGIHKKDVESKDTERILEDIL